MSDPFCPRHGRASRPVEIEGLRCDCVEGLKNELMNRAAKILGESEKTPFTESAKILAAQLHRQEIYDKISDARYKQQKKHPGETIADDLLPSHKLCILVEEVGEVARALNDGKLDDLRDELYDVAACAVGWLESL